MQRILTTSQVAELLSIEPWRVQRLFEDGTLSEPEKFGGRRAIPATMLPLIMDALRRRRWLEPTLPDGVGGAEL